MENSFSTNVTQIYIGRFTYKCVIQPVEAGHSSNYCKRSSKHLRFVASILSDYARFKAYGKQRAHVVISICNAVPTARGVPIRRIL